MFPARPRKLSVVERAFATLVFVILLSASILCILGGVALGISKLSLAATGSRAQGRIVAQIHEQSGRSDSLPFPVFIYTNDAGQSHTITQRTTSFLHDYPVGSAVPILYRPDRPGKAEIGQISLLMFGPIVLILFGSIGAAFMFLWRFFMRKAGRS